MACYSKSRGNWRQSIGATAFALLALFAPAARASDPAAQCDAAAQTAAAATGVPISVLKAISLTETGRKSGGKMRPWPWTVNMEGKGVWFDDPDSAKAYVYKNYKRGARSFDVGCFQLNYKWHGQNFASIEEMFLPEPNALYAARFLRDLYREKGDWSAAAGAYHSRNKKYADRYIKRFDRLRASLTGQETAAPLTAMATRVQPAAPKPVKLSLNRVNRYPFLRVGKGRRGLGSLVPITAANGPGLFARQTPGADG